jgi:MFS family permease
MDELQSVLKKDLRSLLFLPVLLLALFSVVCIFPVFFSNSLVNIASSLDLTVGNASQVLVISQFLGLVVGFIMGFLTVRFDYKSLFLFGVLFFGVGTLGWFFAPNFASLLFFSLFLGIGSAMTGIVVLALIGDFLPLERQGMAVGLTVGVGSIANLIMPQVTSIITISVGWRGVLLWFIFPMAVVSLLFGFFVLRSEPRKKQSANKTQYSEAFKQIFSNKSALACIIGTAFVWFSFLVPVYAVSFFRLHFNESLSTSAIFYSVASGAGLLGVIVGGRLINRVGSKQLTVVAGLIQGVFAFLIVSIPNEWVSVAMWMGSAAFGSAMITGLTSLSLEQVPSFRGTMMSLNQSFQSIGLIVGLMISGLVLNLFSNNFQILYAFFGISSISAALVVYAGTKL